jgi:hypothetical protein
MPDRTLVARPVALRAVARCFAKSLRLLARGQVRFPRANLGRLISFADGTTGRVYRETIVGRQAAAPCFLAVTFRLRAIRGRGHSLFRLESWLNTPLFVGFPGFVSKLWLAHDSRGRYRGLYEWDGADLADDYARALWRVLELVSVPGSIDYRVFPGLRRDDVVAEPGLLSDLLPDERRAWWRLR